MRENTSGGALTEVMLLILLSLFSESYGYEIQKNIKKKHPLELIWEWEPCMGL